MAELGDIVEKVRSKNAGPFWLTIDIFCGSPARFSHVSNQLQTQAVAELFGVDPGCLKRFDIANLHVVKFSFPRPIVQGMPQDRDMHGAQWGCLLAEFQLPDMNAMK